MQEHQIEMPPRALSIIGGMLYLLVIVLGIIMEVFVRGRIVVGGDPTATAANLKSMESLWRIGIALEMISVITGIALGLILYLLTRPVSRDLALLPLLFGLIATAVGTAYSLQFFEALFPLGNAGYLKAFTPEQLNVMAYLPVKAHALGFGISLLLWGPFFLVTGYLIFKSGYLPRALGVLYQIAGLGYMTNGFGMILSPKIADQIFNIVAGPILIGEASLAFWLLLKGVNMEKWNRWGAQCTGSAVTVHGREFAPA